MGIQMTIVEIQEYLDEAINKWRDIRDDESHEHNHMAIYYIDAFQSVRSSIFGDVLPPRVMVE